MKVIGAGMPRTGTLTQKMALEILGLGPCYHMVDVLADLDQAAHWEQALDGRPRWPHTFDGFHSTVDWPGGISPGPFGPPSRGRPSGLLGPRMPSTL